MDGGVNTINLYCPEYDLYAEITFRTREYSSPYILVLDRALRAEILGFTVAAFACCLGCCNAFAAQVLH